MSKKDQKMAAISAAKAPVQGWLNHRDSLVKALADHDEAGAGVIRTLVDTAGANGPFRFEQGRLNFRQVKGGATFNVHLDEERSEM